MINFTKDQRAAIESKGSVIVSAGAGCGKTATMIERIVNKLAHGAELKSMLIVTFTRASAADIRVKLAERLVSLKAEGGSKRRIADEAIAQMPECDIGTLHSFCQRLIKSYFYAAAVDPSATLVEENEAKLIKSAAVREAIDGAADIDGFSELTDALGSRRDDDGLIDVISEIVDFALSTDDPDAYLNGMKSVDEYERELNDIIAQRTASLIARADIIKDGIERNDFKELSAAICEVSDYLNGKIDEFTPTKYVPKKNADGGEVAIKREINERFKVLKTDCKKRREFIAEAETAKSLDRDGKYSKALCTVARRAMEIFATKKAKLGKLDYSDLEHGAKRVLSDDGCRSEISARIKYVFIDEFQDVNPLQAAIADSLKACGAEMFLVGDIKQSIYGFRRCSPDFFRQKYTDPDNGYTKVSLTENHRSTGAVIDFVNGVFDGLMTESYGGVDYSSCKLVSASSSKGEAEFCLVEGDGDENSEPVGIYSVKGAQERNVVNPEAIVVANKIGEYIKRRRERDEKLVLSGKPVTPFALGSIAVLVRSTHGSFVADLVRILADGGVPVSVGRKARISDYPEAVALIDIARCVDDGCDDLALYTALRSPMGGFGDGELYEISRDGGIALKDGDFGGRGGSFCRRVRAYRGRLKERLDAFFTLRDRFLLYSKCHNAADTLGFITSELGYFQHVYMYYGSSPSGAAVQSLISIAADRRCELHSFISFCDKTNFELDVAAGDDAVNIITIHSSKGLEYDYCIVADTAREFMMRDIYERVIVSENGVAVKVPTTDGGRKKLKPTTAWLVEHTRGDRIREEELRLFYVALTRAKDKLTVIGRNKGKISDPARRELDFMRDMPRELVTPSSVDIKMEEKEKPLKKNGEPIERAVRNICEFDYAEQKADGDKKKHIKTCVTAIAADAEDGDYTAAAPVIVDEYAGARSKRRGGVDARARGTAYHRAMELVDFDAPDFNSIVQSIDERDMINGGEIERAAAVMKKLTAGAEFCFRERYFIADFDGTLVQGVIDLLIVYADGTCAIVDYKTTAVDKLDTAAYRTQLDLYARAVEKTTPYKVRAKYLYSFTAGLMAF